MDSDFFRIAAGPLAAGGGNLTDILADVGVGDVGLAGLVTLFVLLILTGKLVPKSTVERENAAAQATLAESRESAQLARQAALELMKASALDAESIRDLTNNTAVNIQLAELVKAMLDKPGGS